MKRDSKPHQTDFLLKPWTLFYSKNIFTLKLDLIYIDKTLEPNLNYGSVWIQLIFAETENWKHCSEIIFKCVNSAVIFIFNEKIAEKCNLWDSWTVHLCTVHNWLVNNCWLNKKKNTWNAKRSRGRGIQTHTIISITPTFIVTQAQK